MAESPRHVISANDQIRARLRELNRRAESQGLLQSWVATIQAAFEKLETAAESAGDPVQRFRQLNLTVYRLLLNRVRIVYSVHDWERILFVQSIDPVMGHPLEGVE